MARCPSSERSLRKRPCYCIAVLFQFVPRFMARGPSGPAYYLPFCSICPRCGARPDRASLIIALLLYIEHGPSGPAYHLWGSSGPACHLRGPSGPVCHLPFMPDLRCSPLHVKSTHGGGGGGGGGGLIVLSRMVMHAVASMPKTAKCACVANKVKF